MATSTHTTPDELLASRVTLSRAEAARVLGIDVRTLAKAIDAGDIAAVRYAGRVLVLAAPLRQQLGLTATANTEAVPPEPGDTASV